MIREALSEFLWRVANRMRSRSFVLPARPTIGSYVTAALRVFGNRSRRLEEKVDRLSRDLAFLRRSSGVYLGDGIALTFLADETPILVNSNDFGGPINLLSEGTYEPDNLDVLFSFLKPESLVLDIGANLGFFTLQLARRLRGAGRVIAFEPHPFLYDLMSRSVYFNGFRERVTAYNFGLSDREGPIEFQYPVGHLGGGHVTNGDAANDVTSVTSELRMLDQVLPPGTAVDLVKIDVEEHELQVLGGMRRVLSESPSIAILLEKLKPHAGYETDMQALLASHDLELFGVVYGALLQPLTLSEFQAWDGYVVAVRLRTLGATRRAFFCIHPQQLRITGSAAAAPSGQPHALTGASGALLFRGPSWFLRRGLWSLEIDGDITGRIVITLSERGGIEVVSLDFDATTRTQTFFTDHDLVDFECIAHARSAGASLSLRRLVLTRNAERSILRELFDTGPVKIMGLGKLSRS